MTRKHYNLIADAIFMRFESNLAYQKEEIAFVIANALKGTNSKFDTQRFINACVKGR